MKKLFSIIFLAVTIFVAAAQPIEQSKFYDNLSLSIKGGVTTPLSDPINHFKGIFGIEFKKDITPIFGIGLEGEWIINTSRWPGLKYSNTMIDHQYVGAYSTTNWMNLLGGYKGTPRFFEFESVLGIGWGHSYGIVDNYIMAKTGLNFNFNILQELTINIKPAIAWNLTNRFNKDYAALQLQVGATYYFKNSNGKRHFILCDKVATQQEVDNMNDKINKLRQQIQEDHTYYHDIIEQLTNSNNQLSKQLHDCFNKPAEIVEVVKFPPIQFMYDSAEIPETTQSILKTIAEMILHQDGSYAIIGYASEEGDEEYNNYLSFDRAESVKNALINYGVPADRLITEGFGETNEFSADVPALNRVVIIKN